MDDTERLRLKLDYASHFEFGKNWKVYAARVGGREIGHAQADLVRLLGRERLDGLTFLDIGCGSGIHTLSSLRLGAERVRALDIDPNSVEATSTLVRQHWTGSNFSAAIGNILLMTPGVERYDVVYSWGVLHHTGDMWEAITRAAEFVKPGGMLVIALYRRTRYCEYWVERKRRYTQGGKLTKGYLVAKYVLARSMHRATTHIEC